MASHEQEALWALNQAEKLTLWEVVAIVLTKAVVHALLEIAYAIREANNG